MGPGILDNRFSDAGLAQGSSGALEMRGIPLVVLAEEVGTPAYIYDAQGIRERYAELDAAFGDVPHRICYAVKANSNLAVLHLLQQLGAGADIVSGGELLRALSAGHFPQRIVFSGVGKTDEELMAAVMAGVGLINVESLAELRRLAVLSELHDFEVNVGLRINPDVTVDTHPYITTGKGGLKFGIPHDQLGGALDILAEAGRLHLVALAMHLGSQLMSPEPFAKALERLVEMLDVVREAGHDPQVLDIGGGLGIRYHEEAPMTPGEWLTPLHDMMRASGCTIQIEPGRFLVGAAGVLLTRVVAMKQSGGRELAVVDAAMNDLLRPSLYKAWHEIVPVEFPDRGRVTLDIVGPVCESGDFLALDREMPGVGQGDLLVVLGAGAYGFSMSSNYNSRPRAVEVLVDAGRWAVIRPRERLTDLFRDEVATPFAAENT